MTLLNNGNFDSPTWHQVTGTGASGLVADYWTPWWVYRPGKDKIWWNSGDDNGYLQPEFCRGEAPPPDQVDKVPRWLGRYAQGWFSNWRVSVAGVYQVVPTIPGCTYRLSASGMGWSNDGGTDQSAHNPRWSEGVGTAQYYAEADPNWPAITLTGNSQIDAIPNLFFQLAVLPSGNPAELATGAGADVRDMFSPNLIRGKAAHTYNTWAALPPIEFVATGNSAVVVLIGANMWGFMHTHWYFDNVALEIIDVPVEPPEPPPVNYVVGVHLLPQDATRDETDQAMNICHPLKQSIVFSADDARRLVQPGLPGSHVVVWAPKRWGPGDIVEWMRPCVVKIQEFL